MRARTANGREGSSPGVSASGSRAGFTLMELLVVIAIIAMLAAMVLPALASARRKAYVAGCVSNLRELGVALNIYVEEQGFYPLASDGDGLGSWQRALRPLDSEAGLYCPQPKAPSAMFVSLFHPAGSTINPHYGYNALGAVWNGLPQLTLGLGGDFVRDGLNGWFQQVPERRVTAPSQMIAFADSGAFLDVPSSGLNQPSNALYITFPFLVVYAGQPGVGSWHSGGANALFCDGHAAFAQQSYWTNATSAVRSLWNNDHQPHPEYW